MSQTIDPNPNSNSSSTTDTVKLVYLLYFAGFIVGITSLIGVVVAYLKRGDADSVAASHFTYQIRTFWIGFLFIILSTLLMVVAIGFFTMLAWVLWAIIRSVKGFMLISEGKPIPEPETWLW